MAKGKKEVSMEAGLWNACNKLRGSVSATDYVNVVLGLLFLRFAYDKFNAQREKLLADEETADLVLRRILCKRYSTNVKNGAVFCACAGLNSLGYRSPVQALQYARPQGVNAARACREAYSLGIR